MDPSPGGKRTLRRFSPAIRLAVGILLLGWLLAKTDLKQFGAALLAADHRFTAAGFGCFLVLALAETLRLQIVLSNYRISLPGAAHLHFVGMFFSNFIPSSLGAEVYRVHLLRKLSGSLAGPIALLLVLRLSGLGLLSLSSCAYLPFAYGRIESSVSNLLQATELHQVPLLAMAAIALVLLACVLLFKAPRRLVGRQIPALKAAVRSVFELGAGPHLLLVALGLLVISCRVASLWCFAQGVGEDLRFLDLLLVVTLVQLVSLVPISLGALGVREGSMVVGLSALGASLAHGMGVAILSRCALWAFSLAGGVFLLLGRGAVTGGVSSPRGD
ncbi:MAG: lysylphosphatidylglycerol synthase transmembrane domain-containing protein [Planctomycetota bacterium]